MRRTCLLALSLVLCLGFEWPGRVVKLAEQVRSGEVPERREAARLLGEHNSKEAREALLVALDDSDAEVRREAIAAAAKIGMREHVPILIEWLNDPAAETRRAAAEALGVLAEQRAEAALIRSLGDTDAKVRVAATIALACVGGAESVSPLLGRLDDADPSVRLNAVASLGKLGDRRALVSLMARTQDAAIEVRVAALGVLGRWRDPQALATLLRSLEDDVLDVRMAAIAALGQLGQQAAIAPLQQRLQGIDARQGRSVLAALTAIGAPAAEQIIVDELGRAELSHGAIEVLVERVRRTHQLEPEVAQRIVQRLVEALRHTSEPTRASAIEEALIGCARHVSIAAAVPVLLERLQATGTRMPMTALALGATGDAQALLPLLERLEGARDDNRLAILRALDVLTTSLPTDGRMADPLLAALNTAERESIVLTARLLGRTGATRAVPALVALLDHSQTEVRQAAFAALGALANQDATAALLPQLEAPRAAVREAAVAALGNTLSAAQVLSQLQARPSQREAHALATLEACVAAIVTLRGKRQLGEAEIPALVNALRPLLADEDDRIVALALDGLAALGTSEAADAIAMELRNPSMTRRVQAAHALGSFDDPRVRHVLRFVMSRDHVDVATAAAAALGRTGDSDDARHLAQLARRFHWPFPAAASYAVALIARRGALTPIASHAMLCTLGRSREPIVRANVALAMAQLGAPGCPDGGPDPLRWMQAEHGPEVRAAASRWAYAAARANHVDGAAALRALQDCAASDPDSNVAQACAAPQLPALDSAIRRVVFDAEGRAPLTRRTVALELADGTLAIVRTDVNGRASLGPTPGTQARVIDPGLLPLEPASPAAPEASAPSHPAGAPPAQP